MPKYAPFEVTLDEMYVDDRDAFDALVRHVAGIDRELLYATRLRPCVSDVEPVKGKPCTLTPDARVAVAQLLADHRIVLRRKGDAVHVTLKPVKRTQAFTHPVDARTKTQRKHDREMEQYHR